MTSTQRRNESSPTVDTQTATLPEPNPREIRNVVLSSFLGTTIEYYDFLLYTTAATIVFPTVFFSELPDAAALIVSFLTLAAGYVARPIGGAVFGHFGDVLGRKKMLVLSLTIMGVASVLIGLLPSTDAIGPAAGIILVCLRFIQGIAIGGEWGGATLMTAEHARGDRRGFISSFTNSGAPAGLVLGNLLFALFALLPEEQFLTWGWRVPFVLSAILLVVGLLVRTRVAESPVFLAAAQKPKKDRRAPILEIIRHPGTVIKVGIGCMANPVISILPSTIALSYAVTSGLDRSAVLAVISGVTFVQIFTIPVFAHLSDRFGRKRIMIAALIAAVAWVIALFPTIATGHLWAVALIYLVGVSLIHAALIGPMPSFLSEQFGTGVRYSGISIGYQLSNVVGGFIPAIITAILASAAGLPAAVGTLAGIYVVSALVLATMSERKGENLSEVRP